MARRFAFIGAILATTALLAWAALPASAGAKKSDSEVKVSATVAKPDAKGNQLVTVTLEHNKGWHTYANPVRNLDFDSNKTVVTVSANGKPLVAKIDYPTGKVTKDSVVGDYNVYEDKVNIYATIQRPQGDNTPLEVDVKIIACHEKGLCLLPATVKVKVQSK
jgi:DsbC/DsbD-like thiol-disulfide interchange protein